MRILFVGDVVGRGGTRFLQEKLPALRRLWGPDLTVVNGENAAEGNGILPSAADDIMNLFKRIVEGGCSIVMSTHNITNIQQYPSRTVRFYQGRLEEIDIHSLLGI